MERVITSEAKRKSPPPSDVTFEEFLEWADVARELGLFGNQ